MAVKKEVKKLEPLGEAALRSTFLELQHLNEQYADLDRKWDDLAAKVLATMPPGDVRQYDDLRCMVVQAWARRVDWKKECLELARKLAAVVLSDDVTLVRGFTLRRFLVGLVKRYTKKANKPSVQLKYVKTELEDAE